MMTRNRCLAATAALVLAVVAPAVAATPAPHTHVPAGMDLWQTLGSGATGYSFAANPLPAGFFCEGSEAFAGDLKFEGVPLKTIPDQVLGTTDTIIERLDDAVYDAHGVAQTRIRARALSLQSSTLIHNSCGDWQVFASLEGEQPVTTMTIRRTSAIGGLFDADLKLQVKLTFRQIKGGATRELVQQIDMPTTTSTPISCATTANSVAGALRGFGDIEVFHPAPAGEKSMPAHAVTVKAGVQSNGCVVGTQCDPNNPGNCMYVYSWHSPAANESHFTQTPCQLGYTQYCSNPPPQLWESRTVSSGPLLQLRELRRLGILDRPAEEVLKRQIDPGSVKN